MKRASIQRKLGARNSFGVMSVFVKQSIFKVLSTITIYPRHTSNWSLSCFLSFKKINNNLYTSTLHLCIPEYNMVFQHLGVVSDTYPSIMAQNYEMQHDSSLLFVCDSNIHLYVSFDIFYIHIVQSVHFLWINVYQECVFVKTTIMR